MALTAFGRSDVPSTFRQSPTCSSTAAVAEHPVETAKTSAAAEVTVTDLTGSVLNRFEVADQPSFNVQVYRSGFGGAAVSPDGRHLAVLTDNGLGFAVIVACSFIAYALRISVEEKVLLQNLGEEYRRYAQRTKRLIPGIF